MTTEQWIAASSVAAVLVAAIAIIVSMTHVRDQLRTLTFLVYTDRYAKIMGRLPYSARRPGGTYQLSALSDDERDEALAAFREYFNMCAEEMWLKSTGRIDSATWKVWNQGIKEAARVPSFAEAWQELADEYRYFTKFRLFMDALVAEIAKEPPAPVKGRSTSGTVRGD